jgi:hypothetical protein
MGGTLAAAARFQISLVFLLHCMVTYHFFAGWPFDGVMKAGATTTMDLDGAGAQSVFLYTDIKDEQYSYNVFNFKTQAWYTEDQDWMAWVYALLNIFAVAVFTSWYFGEASNYGFHKLFKGVYVGGGGGGGWGGAQRNHWGGDAVARVPLAISSGRMRA